MVHQIQWLNMIPHEHVVLQCTACFLCLSNHGCAFHKVLINQSKIRYLWVISGAMDAMAWKKGTPMAGGGPGGEEPAAPRSAATGGRDLPGDRRLRTGGAVGEGGLQLDELGFMDVYGGFMVDSVDGS